MIGEDIIDELSLENLKGIVDGLSTEDTDNETKRQIAIEYCEILKRKGYGKIVEKVFGKDFTSKINEDTIAEIQHNITKLDSEARYARDDIRNQTPTVSGLPESFGTNNSVSGKLSIATDLEGVKFSSSTPGVRIDEHGKITVTSNGTKEPMTIIITASFDSVQSQRPLTITIQPAQATQQSNGVGSATGTGEAEDANNTAQTKDLKSLEVSDLSELGINISGYFSSEKCKTFTDCEGSMKEFVVNTYIPDMEKALLKKYPEESSKIYNAVYTMKSYFTNLIEELDNLASKENNDDFDYDLYKNDKKDQIIKNEELKYYHYYQVDDTSIDRSEYSIRVITYDDPNFWGDCSHTIEIDRSFIAQKMLDFLKAL